MQSNWENCSVSMPSRRIDGKFTNSSCHFHTEMRVREYIIQNAHVCKILNWIRLQQCIACYASISHSRIRLTTEIHYFLIVSIFMRNKSDSRVPLGLAESENFLCSVFELCDIYPTYIWCDLFTFLNSYSACIRIVHCIVSKAYATNFAHVLYTVQCVYYTHTRI